MYTFRQKTEISRRIAKTEDIDLYRKMLKPHRASAAGRIMQDRQALAESLVYNLLDFYTEEQLTATPAALVTSQMGRPKSEDSSPAVKKKSQNSRNILRYAGRILTTLWYALQTAYSLTASTVGAAWQKLKGRLKALPPSLLKPFRK